MRWACASRPASTSRPTKRSPAWRERLAGVALDELICNAGILREDGLDDRAYDDIRAQLEVNAIAPLRVVAALHRNLRRGGKIALITSRMGSIGDNGSGGYYGYRMSKAALNAAGMSLARDLGVAGIAVAILHPGYVRTDMTGGQRQHRSGRRGRAAGRSHRRAHAGDDRDVLARERPGPALVVEIEARPEVQSASGMRILYGVVGEGMGHAMRSGVVLDHLTKNHEVQVVVSGRAHDYLVKRASERLSVRKIWGLNIVYEDNEVAELPHRAREPQGRGHGHAEERAAPTSTSPRSSRPTS